VHFKVPVDRKSLSALMARDTDAFNRWEAGQALATDVLRQMTDAAKSGATPRADMTYVDAIGEALARADEDHAFAAQMLAPPLENELALAMTPPDPDAIHVARTTLIRAVAAAHAPKFEALYRKLGGERAFNPDTKSAGRRALRNACLRYLTAADDETSAELADAHYRAASNMTDMIAGLAALTRMASPRREAAFSHFHDRFRSDPLVLDKWMSLQAGSCLPGTVDAVRAVMKQPVFDIRNPNRVRSLVGAFSANHLRFHAKDGGGYRLVSETIATLDKINPQVAARMSGAFEAWRRYDSVRQDLMRGELEKLGKLDGLSSNLFEVVGKMLE
jgi:aminopeptidase N